MSNFLIDTFVCVVLVANGDYAAVMDTTLKDLQSNPENRRIVGSRQTKDDFAISDSSFL